MINNPIFRLRIKSHFENSDVSLDNIAPIAILNSENTKTMKQTLLIQQQFAETRSVTSE